jgi:hypothetical protein
LGVGVALHFRIWFGCVYITPTPLRFSISLLI